ERVRLFVVGCSIGRGAADRLSDVDALVGVQERTFDDMARSSAELVRAGGEVLDIFQQIIPPTSADGRRSQHTYAHYVDGVELDLALTIAREIQQPRPDWVVLYDPDETVGGEPMSKAASADDVRAWGFNCLVRLHACTKYLTRRSRCSTYCCARGRGQRRLWARLRPGRRLSHFMSALSCASSRGKPCVVPWSCDASYHHSRRCPDGSTSIATAPSVSSPSH